MTSWRATGKKRRPDEKEAVAGANGDPAFFFYQPEQGIRPVRGMLLALSELPPLYQLFYYIQQWCQLIDHAAIGVASCSALATVLLLGANPMPQKPRRERSGPVTLCAAGKKKAPREEGELRLGAKWGVACFCFCYASFALVQTAMLMFLSSSSQSCFSAGSLDSTEIACSDVVPQSRCALYCPIETTVSCSMSYLVSLRSASCPAFLLPEMLSLLQGECQHRDTGNTHYETGSYTRKSHLSFSGEKCSR